MPRCRAGSFLGWIVAAGLLACGCAPSVLIPRRDADFTRSTSRLARSDAAVLGLAQAPTPDRALFLQAESFDLYRFTLRRSADLTLAAQILAATTDFSPLNYLAAGLEVDDLRLQAYNAAAQLYEALLERYPDSPLAPLALYRLGWVYRNVDLPGFPTGAEGAVRRLRECYPDSPLVPWALAAAKVPYRTQSGATAWSILPGAGQIYVGQWASGAVRLSVAAGFSALALAPIGSMLVRRRLDWVGVILSTLGVVGLQVTYTTAYQDAERGALEFNEARERDFDRAHPDAP